jgi:hypothetical protein
MQRYHSIADRQIRQRRQRISRKLVDARPTNGRKRHPYDCGKKQCALCHFGKTYYNSPEQDLDGRRAHDMLRDWYDSADHPNSTSTTPLHLRRSIQPRQHPALVCKGPGTDVE